MNLRMFITNRGILKTALGLKRFGKKRKCILKRPPGFPDGLSKGGWACYFTYLSSQPKNSRFQTSEFWGLKT